MTQPYPGLRPFERTEAKLFFGRADQLNRMLARLEENRFLAVVGSSGSGKSSLVRAGLLPILEKGYLLGAGTGWKFVVMRPGGDPFGNLAAEFHRELAVDTDGHDPSDIAFTKAELQTSPRGFLDVVAEAGLDKEVPLLLLVDQFEEIFRFLNRHRGGGREGEGKRAIHEERNDATAFVNLLLTTAKVANKEERPIYVMITMRSDFIGKCDVFPDLPQAISDSQFLVPRLTRQQMQEIIEKPLLLFGSNAAPELVNQMLNDTGTDPDQLPLMQHALMRTWFAAQARWSVGDKEKVLNLGDYNNVDRFAGALSQHLEEAWDSLAGEREQMIAQQLFLCLSERTAEGALVRRIAKLSEVAAMADVEAGEVIKVVRVFQDDGRNFIMASPPGELSGESDLDISHEALLRQWKRLGDWIKEEAEWAGTYRRLVESAADHAVEADEESLLRGPVLQSSLDWRETAKPTAAWAQRYQGDFKQAMDFLDDSNAQAVANEAGRSLSKRKWRSAVAIAFLIMVPVTLKWVVDRAQDSLDKYSLVQRVNDELELVTRIHDLHDSVSASKSPKPAECKTETFSEGIWGDYKTQLCDEKPLNVDQLHILKFVELLKSGDISETGQEAFNKLKPEHQQKARQLMRQIGEMDSDEIVDERDKLLKCTPGSSEYKHPIHRAIAGREDYDSVCSKIDWPEYKYEYLYIPFPELEFLLVKSYKYPKKSLVFTESTLPRDEVFRVFELMAEKAENHNTGIQEMHKKYQDFYWVFFVLLGWPLLWKLTRWWQRRRGEPFPPKPNAFRRAMASLIDFGIGLGIFILVGTLAWDTFESTIASLVGGTLPALSYLLFSDAIRFKYYRSIGKILSDLRLVHDVSEDRHPIGLLASVKRNAAFVIGVVVTFFGTGFLVFGIDGLDDFFFLPILLFILLSELWLSIVFMKGRTLGDRWSRTRFVDVDSKESRRIDAPPRYIRPDPGPA